eukprot:SAG31_NODE_4766_length_2970_cov_2.727969_3_plen_216_part_00
MPTWAWARRALCLLVVVGVLLLYRREAAQQQQQRCTPSFDTPLLTSTAIMSEKKLNALPGCDGLAPGELEGNLPPQFYCQGRSGLHRSFSSDAALKAWQAVAQCGGVSDELVLEVLKKSKAYSSTKLGITLWSTDHDEGAPFVLREGAADAYDLGADEQSLREEGLTVDLGANLGAVTIQLALLHPRWKVIAAEAMPITFLYLVVNLWLNMRHDM